MDTRTLIEVIGYIGSAVVLISFLMSNVLYLRVINSIGGIISTIYSVIVGAYPVAVMNVCLIAINLYYIYKLLNSKKHYHMIETSPEDAGVQYFLEYFKDDIEKYYPQALQALKSSNAACLLETDGRPVSLCLMDVQPDKTARILLDYAIPSYRDGSAGQFLYSHLKDKNLHEFVVENVQEPKLETYFIKSGFEKGPEGLTKSA